MVSISDDGVGGDGMGWGGWMGRWDALTPGSGGSRGLRTGLVFGVRGEAAAREMMQRRRRRSNRFERGDIRLEKSRAWWKLLLLSW